MCTEPLFEYYGIPLKGMVVDNSEDDTPVEAEDEPELSLQ